MALLFMDAFDHYTTADILKKWTVNTVDRMVLVDKTQVVTGAQTAAAAWPGGGQVAGSSGSSDCYFLKTLPSTYATGVVGGWVYFTALPTSGSHIFALFDSTTIQVSVSGDSLGHLTVQRGGDKNLSGGTVLATSTLTVTTNTWYHMELKSTINNTTGVIQLKVNGTDYVASTSGLNTRSSANNSFNGAGWTPNAQTDPHKLFYVCDTSGTVANDFLGVVRGLTLRPAAAGNYAQWTPNSGDNWLTVGEGEYDGDLSFNASTTANQIDSFVTTDVPTGSTVQAIQHVIIARQDAGAARTMAPLQRSSGTDYVGTTQALAAGYTFLLECKSLDPATSAQYTAANLNSSEFGYKLIS